MEEQAAICLEKLKKAKTLDRDPEAAHAMADDAILEFLEAIEGHPVASGDRA